MKVLFLTSNENKVTEANQTLSELGYEIEQFLINGLAPKIIEPQSSEIEIVSEFKIQQALIDDFLRLLWSFSSFRESTGSCLFSESNST